MLISMLLRGHKAPIANPDLMRPSAATVEDPAILWTFRTGGEIWSSPLYDEGRVFFGSNDKTLYAVDLESGSELWRFATQGEVRGVGDVANGIVYFASSDTFLYALSADDGSELWRFGPGTLPPAPPVVAGDVVYLGSTKQVYALDAVTGQELWRTQVGGTIECTPRVIDGRLLVGSNDGYLYAFAIESGTELWRFRTGGRVRSSPVEREGVLFFGSDDHYLYAIDANNSGTSYGVWNGSSHIRSAPAIDGETVLIATWDGVVSAHDCFTGTEVWRVGVGNWITAAMTVAEGVLYACSADCCCYAIDIGTGMILGRFCSSNWFAASATVVGDRVLLGGVDGNLYALRSGPQQVQGWAHSRAPVSESAEPRIVVTSDRQIDSPRLLWMFPANSNGPPVVAEQLVVFGSDNNNLYALDRSTGDLVWHFPTGGPVSGSPAVSGNVVFVGSRDNSRLCCGPEQWS